MRTHEHEDFEILLVVVHDVLHETEPSQSHHLAESRQILRYLKIEKKLNETQLPLLSSSLQPTAAIVAATAAAAVAAAAASIIAVAAAAATTVTATAVATWCVGGDVAATRCDMTMAAVQ